jgi:hypothetical protein
MLITVYWLAAACLFLQLAAASENSTMSDAPHVEHHGVALNETTNQAGDAAVTQLPKGSGASSMLTSSISFLLTALCVAVSRLF